MIVGTRGFRSAPFDIRFHGQYSPATLFKRDCLDLRQQFPLESRRGRENPSRGTQESYRKQALGLAPDQTRTYTAGDLHRLP